MTTTHTAAVTAAASSLPTLEQIAREELELVDGDRAEAVIAMTQRLLGDEVLREALIVPMVREICNLRISVLIRSKRAEVWRAPPPESGRKRVATIAAVNRLSLMNFLLPSGKRLGNATGAEVRAAAAAFLAQGRDMVIKGRWLTSIADTVPAARMVRRVLDEDRLQTLRTQAEAATS